MFIDIAKKNNKRDLEDNYEYQLTLLQNLSILKKV